MLSVVPRCEIIMIAYRIVQLFSVSYETDSNARRAIYILQHITELTHKESDKLYTDIFQTHPSCKQRCALVIDAHNVDIYFPF